MGRRLGQHFLADPAILDRIVDAINPRPEDAVIEIGPGRGTLTARLAPRVGRVIAIEKDEDLVAKLRARGIAAGTPNAEHGTSNAQRPPSNVEVVAGDALEVDWPTLPSSLFPLPRFFKVIGNIPYYITSPLIEKALTPPLPAVVVFLVQREFAERVSAEAGSKTYGALSVGVQVVARVERLFTVRAGAFSPPPRVDSAVVRFTPRQDPLVAPDEYRPFRTFLAGLFSQRRKQMVRSLRDILGVTREQAEGLLRAAGVEASLRPEVLMPAQLVDLFRRGRSLPPTVEAR